MAHSFCFSSLSSLRRGPLTSTTMSPGGATCVYLTIKRSQEMTAFPAVDESPTQLFPASQITRNRSPTMSEAKSTLRACPRLRTPY